MTEQEWLTALAANDHRSLIEPLRSVVSERRVRLFACACAYRCCPNREQRDWLCIAVSERFADGNASRMELEEAQERMDFGEYRGSPADFATSSTRDSLWETPDAALGYEEPETAAFPESYQQVRAAQVHFLRDIFGNPFRPVAADPSWLTSDVVALATGIYEERAFERMPILADALQDAGCDNEDVLNHCRSEKAVGEQGAEAPRTPHVRGCWVIDLLLGKS